MLECSQTRPPSDLLAEVPHMRAYAWLMTNDRCQGDHQVQETLKRLLSSKSRWRDRPYVRVPVFAVLRSFLARENGNGFQSPNGEGGSLGLGNVEAQNLREFWVCTFAFKFLRSRSCHTDQGRSLYGFRHSRYLRMLSRDGKA